MGSVIKTISLDGKTSKIADTIPNFSQWVRAKLLELEEKRVTPSRGYEYTCPACETYWIMNKSLPYLYCRNMDCSHQDDIAHTLRLVDIAHTLRLVDLE